MPIIPLRTYTSIVTLVASAGTTNMPDTSVQDCVPLTPAGYAPPMYPLAPLHSTHTVAPVSVPVTPSVLTHAETLYEYPNDRGNRKHNDVCRNVIALVRLAQTDRQAERLIECE